MKRLILLPLLLLLVFCQCINADVISETESEVNELAVAAEALHANRCATLAQCSSNCSLAGCAAEYATSEGYACTSGFGNAPPSLETTRVDGDLGTCLTAIRNKQKSIVRLPSTTYSTVQTEEFMCSTSALDTQFADNLNSGNLTAWQYVGHYQGGIRLYPGAPQDDAGTCSGFDARLRPWFLAAAAGPRDIVIVVDTSGSMENEGRMSLVRCAVRSLLTTLTYADYVDVVEFSTSARSLGGGMQQATEVNVANLQSKVDNLEPDGGTRFNSGFTSAFSSFGTSTRSSGCQKVILFLSDGAPGDIGHVAHINSLVAQYSYTNNPPRIFTFGMGSGAVESAMTPISCAFGGAHSQIADGTNPLEKMSAYYKFLAASISSDKVRWTEVYTDAFGLGEMVTASRAVYDRSTPVPVLVGVAATDIPITRFLEDKATLNTLLLERSKECPTYSLNDCQMELIRESEGSPKCQSLTCSEVIKPLDCQQNVEGTLNRFCGTLVSEKEATCCPTGVECGASFHSVALALLGSLVLVAFSALF